MKSYKFRLYPTDAQVERLDWTLARCCELYNAALQERKEAWNACKKQGNFYDAQWRKEHAKEYTVTFAEQCRSLTVIRNEIREDLKPSNLSRRPKPKQDENGTYLPNGTSAKRGLNKSIADAGWRSFIAMVCAKAESAGHTTVLLVSPKDTSQICSGCLKKGPHKDLDERTHTCVHCGLVLDRDVNAAHNILRLGLSHQEPS